MPCRTCGNKGQLETLQADSAEWLSQSEVFNICPECAENMVKLGITRVRRSYLIEKFSGAKRMTFYELIYTGPVKSLMNLGAASLSPMEPQYFTEEELPLSMKVLKKMENLTINKVERDRKPTKEEASRVGKVGVMWIGASPKRVTEFGTFVKNVPNYDLKENEVDEVLKSGSFKRV